MCGHDSNTSRAFWARGFAALWAFLALEAVFISARPAEAAPFAYVSNTRSNNVSVIDIASNTVVATIPVGFGPEGVAVAPDGKHAYVTEGGSPSGSVLVIDTTTNTVVATIPLGNFPPPGGVTVGAAVAFA